MTGHRINLDLHRAQIAYVTQETDPGNAGEITIKNAAIKVMRIVTAGAETRTLYDPQIDGVELQVSCDTFVGTCTFSTYDNPSDGNRVGLDQTPNNTIRLDAAGSFFVLRSVKIGTAYRWQVMSSDNVTLVAV